MLRILVIIQCFGKYLASIAALFTNITIIESIWNIAGRIMKGSWEEKNKNGAGPVIF